MESILTTIGTLLTGMLITIANTLAHNAWVLAISIGTAVALKTYVNSEKLSRFLTRRTRVSIFLSVAVGAFTPFCACGTMAVIVGMLTTALPWGPIMAFLTSSPLMSPDGFIMMSGFISLRFAVALTVASLLIGVLSGWITQSIEKRTGFLRDQTRYRAAKESTACGCSGGNVGAAQLRPTCASGVTMDVREQPEQGPYAEPAETPIRGGACCAAMLANNAKPMAEWVRRLKLRELLRGFMDLGIKQILLSFSIFVGIGYLVNTLIPTTIVSALLGANNAAAVPLASLVGLPLYLTTESSIPIIRSLLQSGASEGAMLAFVISGSATSAWVIAALTTFMKRRALALYVGLIVLGSLLCGYGYDLLLRLL